MATVRELVTKWGFTIDDRPLRRMDARIDRVRQRLDNIPLAVGRMTLGFGALSFGIGTLLKKAGDFEQINIAFETLIQDTDKAKKLTEELTLFAQKTPFNLKGVFDATKQLLAYNIAAEDMIPTLTALGNIASAVGKEKLPNLILAYGQVKTAGKLRGQEVRQFTEAGVPVYEAIAEQLKVTKDMVPKLIEQGAVSFETMRDAIQNLANGTGRMSGLMDRQSRTLLGVVSNFQDALEVLAAKIGGSLIPRAQKYLQMAIAWVSANEKLIQSNASKFFDVLIDGMEMFIFTLSKVWRIGKSVVAVMGGLNNVIRMASIALSTFVAIKALTFLGDIGLMALSVGKNFLVMATMSTRATVSLLALKATALMIPLAIGAAMAAVFLLLEDVYTYFQGGKSLTGDFVNNFKKAAPALEKVFSDFGDSAVAKIEGFFNKVNEFMSSEKFAPQREKLGKALAAAIDIALISVEGLASIGYRIGQAIFDGIIEAFVDNSPMLAGALGFESKKSLADKFAVNKESNKLQDIASTIGRFGEADARKIYGDKEVNKFKERQQGKAFSTNDIIALQNVPESRNILKNNPALQNALSDQLLTYKEMFSDPQLVRDITAAQKAVKEFSTTVNIDINGANMTPQQLKKTIEDAVHGAQAKTIREINANATTAVVE